MTKEVYINGMGCVSAQHTLSGTCFNNLIDYSGHHLIFSLKPDFKQYIPAGAIRRLQKGVKNSIVAAATALKNHQTKNLDGIITGTGMGCIIDSEKFLEKLIEYNESFLTPTSFIQSTHNTVGGQIALGLKSKAYNLTYVHGASSFPAAILDAWMQIKFSDKCKFLVGGVDEIGNYTYRFFETIGYQKMKSDAPFNILNNRTKGSVAGEGAAFFVIEDKKTAQSLAKVIDVESVNTLDIEGVDAFIQGFLQRNQLTVNEIDAVVLGNNGAVDFDYYYDKAETLFPESEKVYYKHLFGEFFTAPAIAMWLGTEILKRQVIPLVFKKVEEDFSKRTYKRILIYNQYRGKDHSLFLLENV